MKKMFLFIIGLAVSLSMMAQQEIPAGFVSLADIPYYTYTTADGMHTRTTAYLTMKDYVTNNDVIFGEPWNVQVRPGRFFDLSTYKTLKIAVFSTEEMAGTTANLRCFFIKPDMNESSVVEGTLENYAQYNHLQPVEFNGGEQVFTVDLQHEEIAAMPYMCFIRFIDYQENFNLAIDYVAVSAEGETDISAIQVDEMNKIVDVYNLMGVLIRKDVKMSEATQGLQRGVYIVGNKKIIITE